VDPYSASGTSRGGTITVVNLTVNLPPTAMEGHVIGAQIAGYLADYLHAGGSIRTKTGRIS
jgi:hypothetical protein